MPMAEAGHTTTEWMRELGEQVRARRVDQGFDQAQVAHRASVSRPSVSALENGGGSSLSTLVKVLVALGAEDWLTTLHPMDTEPGPLEMLRRQRNRRARRVHGGGN